MNEALHVWALVPAAASACCVAADRRRVRVPELAASVIMLLAMVDAALLGIVPRPYWAALLIVGAVGLAALRSPRRRHRPRSDDDALMTVHAALGLVAMAALLLAMAPASAAAPAHAHGLGAGATTGLFVVASIAYGAWSAIAAQRAHGRLVRAQFGAMGLATVVMAAAIVV
ncbi:hypothetical protein LQ938_06490 [Microbacterium sp. cx-55]|uniref:hypothetical protein n=1 Tax=Microbacterium sp. cx-55 TaxID=2875948 RepID=UPI001CBBB78F|nr:hypothetical protein [Microbacterium sp. cx-55]MBZ4486608.1 hypothetical protein [Microbacterium sp. cx-55]UGB36425.1 hypothetical protein LQ938_06490 [Microbacterium sp. cx-55]